MDEEEEDDDKWGALGNAIRNGTEDAEKGPDAACHHAVRDREQNDADGNNGNQAVAEG